MAHVNVLKTAPNKVSPVSIGNVLERDRLFALFGGEWPITSYWISGPGGTGKTTLVASYLKKAAIPCAWYQVDALDADPATFFYYFSKSLGILANTSEPLPLFTPEYLPNIDTFALHYFEQAFHNLPPNTWVVIDNFQDAPAGSALESILAFAVRQVPPHITLALISRNNPPPAMTRFLANRTMALIHWNHLAFTRSELKDFLIHSGQTMVTAELVDNLHQFTEGWIAGVILWMLHQGQNADLSGVPADRTRESVFEYFAAEILEKFSTHECTFFLTTAFLTSMTVETVETLTEKPAGDLLERLHRTNCFLERRDSSVPVYQYHPLFRSFLLSRAGNFFEEKEFLNIKRRAAEILAGQSLFEEAIRLFAEINVVHGIETIILNQAPHLITQGRHAVLADWLELLPEERVTANPYLLYWKSFALLATNPLHSGTLCTKAYNLFTQQADLFGRILSWSLVVNIPFMVRNSFADLDQWIVEGDQLATMLPNDYAPDLAARLSSGMLMALLQRNPSRDDFEQWQQRCEALLDQCHDPQVMIDLLKNLCWSYAWMGMLRKGVQLEDRLRVLCADDRFSPLGRIILHHSLAISCITRGEQRESSQVVNKALALAEENGVHVFDFLLLANWCCILLGTGQFDQMPIFLDKMRAALSPFGKLDHGQYHCLSAWYLLQAGQPAQAKGEVEIATDFIDFCDSCIPINVVRVAHAQVYLELGDPVAAEALLEMIRQDTRCRRSAGIQWIIDLASADCAYVQNRTAEAEQYCRSAFAHAREEGIGMIYGLSNRRLGTVCAKALEAGIETNTVREMIKCWHLKPPVSESVSDQWPWPIRITTLGRFRVCCNGVPLVLSAKTPRKPLELLALLIAAGKNGLTREKLADRLWPAADGDMAAQSLATTLHRLRRLLKHSDAILHTGDQLLLNQDLVWVDSWHFHWLALQIETTEDLAQRLKLIEKALTIHVGPLVTGNDHLSMIVGSSQRLHQLWLQVLAAAMPYFVENVLPPVAKDVFMTALMEKETADALVAVFMSSRKADEQPSAIVPKSKKIVSELALAISCGRVPKSTKPRSVE